MSVLIGLVALNVHFTVSSPSDFRRVEDDSKQELLTVYSCAPHAVFLMARLQMRSCTLADVCDRMIVSASGVSLAEMQRVLETFELRCDLRYCEVKEFDRISTPFIAHWRPGRDNTNVGHYVVVVAVNSEGIEYVDPTTGRAGEMSRNKFEDRFSGYVLVTRNTASLGVWMPLAIMVALNVAVCGLYCLSKSFLRRRAGIYAPADGIGKGASIGTDQRPNLAKSEK